MNRSSLILHTGPLTFANIYFTATLTNISCKKANIVMLKDIVYMSNQDVL